jgi:hypothetical protein
MLYQSSLIIVEDRLGLTVKRLRMLRTIEDDTITIRLHCENRYTDQRIGQSVNHETAEKKRRTAERH